MAPLGWEKHNHLHRVYLLLAFIVSLYHLNVLTVAGAFWFDVKDLEMWTCGAMKLLQNHVSFHCYGCIAT